MAKQNDTDTILMLDGYGPYSQRLVESFTLAGMDYPTVVIDDDGFLPKKVTSVYGHFLGDFSRSEAPGKPRYFNQIEVPDFWEITGTNSGGTVVDKGQLRAKIFFTSPTHKRLVKIVDWYNEKGIVRSSDHYNSYGALFARTTFNHRGQKVNRSYFDFRGREKIVENFVTGDIILNDGKVVRIFRSKADFVSFFLTSAGLTEKRIFFNSLAIPFFVMEGLPENGRKDVLFWQEKERDDIPGNMKHIFEGGSKRVGKVVVQRKRSYEKLVSLGARADMLAMRGFVYPFSKGCQGRTQALICTNSDNIEKLKEIVEALQEIHFHIAALTEMSTKLLAFDSYENVSLYPGVKTSVLDGLFDRCGLYLDVNHESEIVSAVYQAFLHDQLIFAFRETLHSPDYVDEGYIFAARDWEKLTASVKAAAADPKEARLHLKRQHERALSESKEDFSRFISSL